MSKTIVSGVCQKVPRITYMKKILPGLADAMGQITKQSSVNAKVQSTLVPAIRFTRSDAYLSQPAMAATSVDWTLALTEACFVIPLIASARPGRIFFHVSVELSGTPETIILLIYGYIHHFGVGLSHLGNQIVLK
ncbi:MAG: hypothetical protein TREMPRED_003582, partial [Tremellales sp. Tagirdzhanova-0007]